MLCRWLKREMKICDKWKGARDREYARCSPTIFGIYPISDGIDSDVFAVWTYHRTPVYSMWIKDVTSSEKDLEGKVSSSTRSNYFKRSSWKKL